jgi:hypothetical protein
LWQLLSVKLINLAVMITVPATHYPCFLRVNDNVFANNYYSGLTLRRYKFLE